jgi:hypothetical protein
MIDKAKAENLLYGQVLHHRTLKNADGSPARCRVNGRCKTWKRRPEDFCLPVKYGLRDCFYLTPANAHEWALSVEEIIQDQIPGPITNGGDP